MRTNYNDQKPIDAKERNSEDIGKSTENKNNAGKTKNQKAFQKGINKNANTTENKPNQENSSIFKL